MNSTQFEPINPWAKVLAIEVLGGEAALLAALLVWRLLPFLNDQVAAVAKPYLIGSFLFLWFATSLIAIAEYRFGIDTKAKFFVSAALSIVPAALSFGFLYSHVSPGLGAYAAAMLTAGIITMCMMISLLLSLSYVELAMRLGERLAPLFDRVFL